ncbi:integrin alpha-L-like isoform X2 [Trachinotus anak]|uniref:integrin alpha-L-like isoform X2 n=1 Tax=Trachinotus anak TaxID=443729 RepID=UPI0039F1E3A1
MKKMHVKNLIVWLTYTVAVAISASLAFNIDTTNPHISTMEQTDFPRNKVLPFMFGKNKGAVFTAAQQLNGSEETCKFDISQTYQCLLLPEIPFTDKTIPVKYFRLSMAEDSTLYQLTVCNSSEVHECHDISYQNSACYKMADHLQVSSFISAFQECTKNTVDLVFLVDGSASMTGQEFTKNKDFIVDIMDSLQNRSIKFAAVQFSSNYRKVFDFNDYQAGRALDKLKEEPHMKSLTNTYRALKFVLTDILENPDAGASRDALKVLVLITDGDPSDTDREGIIKRYADKNILRFVIGVRVAKLDKFRAIASEPTEKYAFKIENYDGLTGILESMQKSIFKMGGPRVARAGDITGELSQSGFSAVLHNVCSSSEVHECHDIYQNSACHKMTDDLQGSSSTSAFECTKKTVDLVFLVDGSASMTGQEFTKNKDFIVDIMDSLQNRSIKFAAVQFSSNYRKVFDFNDYQAGRALDKLKEEPHMKSLTNTYRALKFVLTDILENPDAGASRDALKVLVLITDGDPSDTDREGIIKRYADKNILRFVIGVRVAKLDKFRAIASEPTEKYVFKIENYDRLTGILENFQKRIFTLGGDLTGELSQNGFSAVFSNDTLILGSMGSNSWWGSLQELHEQKETQIEDPHIENDYYMGYSISVGERNNAPLYFMGAPRFKHRGQVIFFRHDCKYWTTAQRLIGDQVGSYFGAELCSVDIDSDGNTDFLLVGAPLFYQPQEMTEGQLYVYTLTDEMQLASELNVIAPSTGGFGTSISSLADLNGDGLRDVAVGAPLEDDNRGTVYIYLGDRRRGIRSFFSQRIMGQNIKPGLRFFGQAITGGTDLGENGLPRIVIGSQGTAIVLRSRPVVSVFAHLSFQPEEISTEQIDCPGNTDENLPMVNLTTCFEMVETTRSKAGTINSGLNISYTLEVDAMTQTYRGFFNPTDKKSRNLIATYELRDKNTCLNHTIYMPKCVEDTLSPISIMLNIFQVDMENASAVLNVDNNREAVVEVPFKK